MCNQWFHLKQSNYILIILYVCVRDVIDVFSDCIVTHGAVLMYGKYECLVIQMLYVLGLVCIMWQFAMLRSA